MVLARIGIGSAAKIAGVMYAVLGLIMGGILALISMVGAGMASGIEGSELPAGFGALFGVGAIVLFPILYGILGIVFGAITAALYNLFAGMVGGLELDLRA
jgi:hypothetical protein